MIKKYLNWLWDGAPATKTIRLDDTDINQFSELLKTYTTEKKWKEKRVKNSYDDNLLVNKKIFNFVTDYYSGHCKVEITITQNEKDLLVNIDSQTYWGRPDGDPDINTRIVNGIENYLKLHTS